jgi:hypothetical protein
MGAVAARAVLGKMACLCCGEQIAAKQQGGSGLAVASCPYCGLMVQAHQGESDKFIRGKLTALKVGEAANAAGEVRPTPKPAPKAPPAPAAAASSSSAPAEEKTIFDYFRVTTKGGAHGA